MASEVFKGINRICQFHVITSPIFINCGRKFCDPSSNLLRRILNRIFRHDDKKLQMLYTSSPGSLTWYSVAGCRSCRLTVCRAPSRRHDLAFLNTPASFRRIAYRCGTQSESGLERSDHFNVTLYTMIQKREAQLKKRSHDVKILIYDEISD